jgi:putative addiction module component (TIGR02574 family)
MTRTDAIAEINATLERLPDERVEMLAQLAQSWARPTVYSSLSDAEKAEIDAALDELDRGEGIAWGAVRAELDAKLKAAGV